MAYVIGIDTGGTYTDAVLFDNAQSGEKCVLRKGKAITTHRELHKGIKSSIEKLHLKKDDMIHIQKVVLSTTLATNAVVEGDIGRVGLILIGDKPDGKLATSFIKNIQGKVNIKGRVITNINHEETKRAIVELTASVESMAISGASSVRNPTLELSVKKTIKELCDIPIVCGHELTSGLGYLDRTNTAIINAGLLPVINKFLTAMNRVLEELKIDAPVFVVKASGSIAGVEAIREKPIETILSGPAASMIGAIQLTGIENGIVSDMGGTTTDLGIVKNKRVELSKAGAQIENWKVQVKSARLLTFGLGGDSRIDFDEEKFRIGPKRVLPACRGGGNVVTPTDLLHYLGEFNQWDKKSAIKSIEKAAEMAGKTNDEYVEEAACAVIKKILNLFDTTRLPYEEPNPTLCAIGAPAQTWYEKAKALSDFKLMIPKYYEVAGAVGAAASGIEETLEAIVRTGEDGNGYLLHSKAGRLAFTKREDAINKAIEVTKELAIEAIKIQNLEVDEISIDCEERYSMKGQVCRLKLEIENDKYCENKAKSMIGKYIETLLKVTVSGKLFQ